VVIPTNCPNRTTATGCHNYKLIDMGMPLGSRAVKRRKIHSCKYLLKISPKRPEIIKKKVSCLYNRKGFRIS
jgi:hypothetical protein